MKKLGLYLVLLAILSCTKDGDRTIDTNLLGSWEKSFVMEVEDFPYIQNEGYEYVSQYTFNNDRSFESRSFIRNIDSGEILAYTHQFLGNYEIQGNRLNLTFDHWGTEPIDDQFADIQSISELVLITENNTWGFSYAISQKNRQLKFDYDPCGPTENCVGELVLFRVE